MTASALPPCVLHEDDDLLVVEKPPGWNTHAPAPFAGEGIYDWLRAREPRWAGLAILHRLDKDTSGVMVFGKTPRANRSLTDQFTRRLVTKRYLFLTENRLPRARLRVESELARVGSRYRSQHRTSGDLAITDFAVQQVRPDGLVQVEARPQTGRTHQIRVHAAESGFPVLGDSLYGGAPASWLGLQAVEVAFAHPMSGQCVMFRAKTDYLRDLAAAQPQPGWSDPIDEFTRALAAARPLREAIIEPTETDCYRLVHGSGEASQLPGQYLDHWGTHLLWASTTDIERQFPPGGDSLEGVAREVAVWAEPVGGRSVYRRALRREAGGRAGTDASPQWLWGDRAAESFVALENRVRYEIRFGEGYSVGLFLDQRDNRRRILVNHVAPGFPVFASGVAGAEVLNVFAYTCAFSVCAALAGARTTSVDLSRKHLEWGRRNFALNALDPTDHHFVCGDAFDWLRRLAKRGRRFDLVLLDPPTSSTSKASGRWQAERDFGRLVGAALPLLKPDGVLFASTNAARWTPVEFVGTVKAAVARSGRSVTQEHYAPQPPDFPVTKSEPAYLKSLWLRLA